MARLGGALRSEIERLPDLSLENIDAVSKMGTDDEGCKNLRKICSEPGLSQNNMEHNGQNAPENAAKTALLAHDSRSVQTLNQRVTGSIPVSPIRLLTIAR